MRRKGEEPQRPRLAGTLMRVTKSLSAVQAVVDAIDEVGRAGRQADQVALVLLGDVLELIGHARDVVDVGNLAVRAMGADETRDGREHARELAVGLDVGVVDVDLVRSPKVFDTIIVHHRLRGTGCEGHCGCCGSGGDLLPLGVQPAHQSTHAEASGQHSEHSGGLSLHLQLLQLHLRRRLRRPAGR